MDIKKGAWKVAEAKQRFSALIRESATEPQKIYNRDRLVAAVVSPEELERLQKLDRELPPTTLGELMAEGRQICIEENYELDVGERVDRKAWEGVLEEEEEE